jgi:hypothetical protein
MVRRWTADKELDASTFRYTVDVPVPRGGLGRRLEQMVGWCNQRAGLWALHSHSVDSRNFARFYFLSQPVAETFARQWARFGERAARLPDTGATRRAGPRDGPTPAVEPV